MSAFREELAEWLAVQPIIDCHTHLKGEEDHCRQRLDLFEVVQASYVRIPLMSAGLSPDWLAETQEPGDRWVRLEPYLRRVENTAFCIALMRSLRDLYGMEEGRLTESNWQRISDAIAEKNRQPAWYHEVLEKRCRFARCIVDVYATATVMVALLGGYKDWYEFMLNVRPTLMTEQVLAKGKYRDVDDTLLHRKAMKIDVFLYGYQKESCLPEVEHYIGVKTASVETFQDYLMLVDSSLEKLKGEGVVALKSVFEGVRSLSYELAREAKARQAFETPTERLTPELMHEFENFMMHYIADRAGQIGLPMQIHTGYPGPSGSLDPSRPERLNPLFIHHPRTQFVVMHGGYPYTSEAGLLAQYHPNVWLDFSWHPHFSLNVARRSLSEWLEVVPGSKLIWGSDGSLLERVYAATIQMREVLADVLVDKVDRGTYDRQQAYTLIKRILYENPAELFGVD